MPSIKTIIIVNAAITGAGFLAVHCASEYIRSIYDSKNSELLRERIAMSNRFPMEQQYPHPKI